MALPSVLKNMNTFHDGESYVGRVSEVTIPKIATVGEDWRGGGMLGNIVLDMGLEKIEFEWKPGGVEKKIYQRFGEPAVDGVQLRWLGAYQDDSTGQVTAVEITVRGRHQEIDPGNAKAGDPGGHTVKTVCSYYRLKIGGVETIEIDLLNCVFVVNGVDRYAQIRAAIGL